MSNLSKLLVKLSREGIRIELTPYDTALNNNINAIRIKLFMYDKAITGIVTFTSIEIMNIDMLEHKINELYEKMITEG